MMLAAGFFTESAALDIGVAVALIGAFATVIGLLVQAKKDRGEEVRAAVQEVINASPEKVVISPAPLIVEMKKKFVTHEDWQGLDTRVTRLEDQRTRDRDDLLARIDGVPARVIALLRDTKGLL